MGRCHDRHSNNDNDGANDHPDNHKFVKIAAAFETEAAVADSNNQEKDVQPNICTFVSDRFRSV